MNVKNNIQKWGLVLLFALFTIPTNLVACIYQLQLIGSSTSGWGEAKVTVMVNGIPALNNVSLAEGLGTVTYSFSADSGSLITTEYYCGYSPTENEYKILDSNGNTIAYQGSNGTIPNSITGIIANCQVNNDLKMVSWDSPLFGTLPNSTSSITITLKNNGLVAQSGFNLKYSIDGGTTYITENISNSIAPGSSLSYTFNTTANLSSPGLYHCIGIVDNLNDSDPLNDTIFFTAYVCSSLSGTYSVGTGINHDFNTLNQVAEALSICGISGPVTFEIAPGTYEEQVEFFAVYGASSINTITFTSISNSAQDVIITNREATISNNYTIKLNGADYFNFKYLTIEARHNQFARTIVLDNNATHNTFYRNTLVSFATGTSSAVIYDDSYYNNDSNTYLANQIIGGQYGVYLSGKSAYNPCSGIVIDSNAISKHDESGIYITYLTGVSASNNTVNNERADAEYGIRTYALINGFEIEGNIIISNNSAQYTGIRIFRGNYSSYTSNSTLPGVVSNNMVSILTDAGNSNTSNGIRVENSDSVIVAYNSVYIAKGGNYSAALYQTNVSTNTHGCKYLNNILINLGSGYAGYFSTPSNISMVDYNNYFSLNSSKLAYWNGNQQTIAALQAASGKNVHSISSAPIFDSDTNLHTLCGATNNTGIPIPEISTDFDGEPRSLSQPDIGADEYSQFANDLKVEQWIQPIDTVSTNTNMIITIKVTNTGTTPQSNIPVLYSVNGNQSFVTETILSTIQPDSSLLYTFTTPAIFTSFGLHSCIALTGATNEQNTSNDTAFSSIFACSPLSGTYTLGHHTSNDFSSLQQFSQVLKHCGINGPVELLIDSGRYEGKTLFFNTAGASPTNTITIKGRGMETIFIHPKASQYSREVFEFDNAKYFVLDSLFISTDSLTNYFTAIRFHNQSDYNTVRNCIIDPQNANYVFGIMASWSSSSTASGGDNGDGLLIENNIIIGNSSLGIHLSGNNYNDLNNDNHVKNNILINCGIRLFYQNAIEISGNTIIGQGIYSYGGRNELLVTNNHISLDYNSDGIKIEKQNYYGGTNTAWVYNNAVSIRTNTGGSLATGLYSYNNKHINFYYNSISINGSATNTNALRIDGSSSASIAFKNNILSNFTEGYAVYSSVPATSISNDYNMLYTDSTHYCFIGGMNHPTLGAWQTATANASHSKRLNPYFFTETDLRAVIPNNYAVHISTITTDINGNIRSNSTPDMGAYEYNDNHTVSLGPDTTNCPGTTLTLIAQTNTDYLGFNLVWVSGLTGDTLQIGYPIMVIDTIGTYIVHLTHPSGIAASDTILVQPPFNVNFSGLSAMYCQNDTLINMVGQPIGGIFSGSGVSGTSFNPNIAGIGTHTIKYIYTDTGSLCTIEKSKQTTIQTVPVLNISNDTSICLGDSIPLYATNYSIAGYSYLWNTNDTTYKITVAPAVNSMFYVTAIEGNCSTTDSILVEVNLLPWVTLPSDTSICANDSITITAGNYNSIFWSTGNSSSSVTINNGVFPIGQNTLSVIVANSYQCTATDSMQITIEPLPNSSLPDSTSVCGLNSSILLDAGSNIDNMYVWSDGSTGNQILVDTSYIGGASGSVSISITNLPGCTTYDTVDVFFKESPKPFIGNDTNLCWESSMVLETESSYSSYIWNTGASTASITIDSNIFNLGTNQFYVEVTNSEDCSGSDTIWVEVSNCLGTGQASMPIEQISVYPNPGNGKARVILSGLQSQKYVLRIYDANGSVIYKTIVANSHTSNKQELPIDISKYANGVYLINLSSNQLIQTLRLIKD